MGWEQSGQTPKQADVLPHCYAANQAESGALPRKVPGPFEGLPPLCRGAEEDDCRPPAVNATAWEVQADENPVVARINRRRGHTLGFLD